MTLFRIHFRIQTKIVKRPTWEKRSWFKLSICIYWRWMRGQKSLDIAHAIEIWRMGLSDNDQSWPLGSHKAGAPKPGRAWGSPAELVTVQIPGLHPQRLRVSRSGVKLTHLFCWPVSRWCWWLWYVYQHFSSTAITLSLVLGLATSAF